MIPIPSPRWSDLYWATLTIFAVLSVSTFWMIVAACVWLARFAWSVRFPVVCMLTGAAAALLWWRVFG